MGVTLSLLSRKTAQPRSEGAAKAALYLAYFIP
jgi:hypothetical protein